ncbi:redoxin domain-containing protein [Haliscomenobacter sp.]|uniref:redoxin domain-containing protein n=1 Tax=Haliscomenobacter sp. TaxID=2717303 RepID=UPI003BAABC7C
MKALIFWTCMLLMLHTEGGAMTPAYRIEVTIVGFSGPKLYLGYYLGDKQYVLDTADAIAPNTFVFSGAQPLETGIYFVALPPKNDFFQILITPQEQFFSIQTTQEKLNEVVKIEGSQENGRFYAYLRYLRKQQAKAEAISEIIKQSKTKKTSLTQAELKRQQLNTNVAQAQKKWVQKNKGTYAATIIGANLHPTPPLESFAKLDSLEKSHQLWMWTRQHYFDYLPLGDSNLLRTPFLFEKVDYFIRTLTPQHPDSICRAIDTVLHQMGQAPETFQFYLIHFLNSFAASNFVGMDAVYVHLVEKYYNTGKAPWASADQLAKLSINAKKLKPLLIGKIAPDISLECKGQRTQLHQIQSPYTVLFFWRYDCSHCTESLPAVKKFYEKYAAQGITLVAICVNPTLEQPNCAKYLQENQMPEWFNATDPSGKYFGLYNLETTPQVYILDQKKEILSKQVPADQLELVMDKIIEMNKKAQSKTE